MQQFDKRGLEEVLDSIGFKIDYRGSHKCWYHPNLEWCQWFVSEKKSISHNVYQDGIRVISLYLIISGENPKIKDKAIKSDIETKKKSKNLLALFNESMRKSAHLETEEDAIMFIEKEKAKFTHNGDKGYGKK